MIAVLGATGFTGHRAVRALRDAHPDEEIVAVVRKTSDRHRLAGIEVTFRVADALDRDALRDALHAARRIVCTVSLGFGAAPTICDAVASESRDHVIFFSTTSVSTRVPNRTREIRLEAERRIESSTIPATIMRPTMIYGRPGDRNVERLLRFLRRSPVMPLVAGGRALQQPVHVDDLASAVVAALRAERTIGKVYTVPGPLAMSFARMARLAAAATGRRVLPVSVPASVAIATFRVWQRTGRAPRVSKEQIERLLEDKAFGWRDAQVDFAYNPRPFSAGVAHEAGLLGLSRGQVKHRAPLRDEQDG
jgi:uncharacterized protein YbjT (DUF2867 family)